MSTLPKELESRMAAITNTAEELAESINNRRQVRAYIVRRTNDIPLNNKQKEMLARYQYVYNAKFTGKYGNADIEAQLTKMFGISLHEARNDVRDSQDVFGNILSVSKTLELSIMLEMNRRFMKRAEDSGDMKSLASFEKNRLAIVKEMQEQETIPGANFEGHEIIVTYDPKLLGVEPADMMEVLKVINEKRDKKLNENFIEDAIVLDK